ncbi:uncharacterized protein LOC121754162 isoform X1 [Salvia splendens]|uniref:uncharacterized protein LOC121754162 isoform X1 n=1 Tax=Salvia splendens TaxID=180675 RepID=UPI001C25F99A|nr:uncharacterized protein LOC121754162 isoform X1 [Salvia splendens]
MSCFFSCFRVKDSGDNLVNPSPEPCSKNALSSLFQCDDEPLRKGEECQNRLPGEINIKEFKDEKLEKQSTESSVLAGSCSLLDSPSSCMTDGYYTGRESSSLIQRSDTHYAAEIHSEQSKNESVQSHLTSDRSAISSIFSEQSGSAGARSVTKPLPYPNMKEEELGDESSAFSHQGQANKQKNVVPVIEEEDGEGSLTSWFKPISAKRDGSNKQLSSISSQSGKPPADRPILGTVAAHWNDVELEVPHDPPKWWDGNGIPNSTNKYKEDQKVSWHATTFEERLEKALSEESLISHKKPTNTNALFELNEESDTATSHFQSSPHPGSVVSF